MLDTKPIFFVLNMQMDKNFDFAETFTVQPDVFDLAAGGESSGDPFLITAKDVDAMRTGQAYGYATAIATYGDVFDIDAGHVSRCAFQFKILQDESGLYRPTMQGCGGTLNNQNT